MIVAKCPRCAEAFRVPSGELPEDAYAQCPWCCETFPLVDVMESLPPLLQVLGPDGQSIQQVSSATSSAFRSKVDTSLEASFADPVDPSLETVVDDGTDGGMPFDQYGQHGPLNETASDVEDLNDWGSVGGEDSSPQSFANAPAPMRVTQSPGRRRKQNAGFRTFLGILLGGLAALPLAGALLILLGQTPDLGFWPFEGERPSTAGDTNDTPRMFDGDAQMGFPMDDDPSQVAAESQTDPADMAIQAIVGQTGQDLVSADGDGRATGRPSELSMPGSEPASGDLTTESPSEATTADEVASVGSNESEGDLPATAPASSSAGTGSAITMPEADSRSSVALVPIGSTSTEPDDPRSAEVDGQGNLAAIDRDIPAVPSVADSEDLIASVNRAELEVQRFSEGNADPEERKVQLRNAYVEIAKACSLADSESVALRRLASTIKASPIRNEIGYAGSLWIDLGVTKRPSDGIAMIGKVGSGVDGPTLSLESGKVVNLTGQTPLPTGEQVLALGRVVDGESSTVEVLVADELP